MGMNGDYLSYCFTLSIHGIMYFCVLLSPPLDNHSGKFNDDPENLGVCVCVVD
jgi:hypothetical protein